MFNVTHNASIADSVLLNNSVEWKSILNLNVGEGEVMARVKWRRVYKKKMMRSDDA